MSDKSYTDLGFDKFLTRRSNPSQQVDSRNEDALNNPIENFLEFPTKFLRSGHSNEKPVTGEKKGSIYYEEDTNELRVWNGTAWVSYILTSGDTMEGNLTMAGRLLVPMGEISYFSMTGTAVAIAAQSDGSSNMVVCPPVTTLNNDMEFDNGGSNNGRLRYTGETTKTFHVACTITIAPVAANDTFVFGVAKGGTVIAGSKVLVQAINSAAMRSTAMHVMVSLATNEYLELYVGNTTDADDVTIHSLNLFAMGM